MSTKSEIPNGRSSLSPNKEENPSLSSATNTDTTAGISSYLFAEKLVPVIVDLFLQAPSVEKNKIFPDIVQGLGR